ncbi:MAG: hypothetical protein MJ203_01980 [archaeon]|nr:hypothetical protein [archaeon]
MPRPGGLSNKFGNYYEDEWTIQKILEIYRGGAESIELETSNVENEFEFILKTVDGIEYHQAKSQKTKGTWTFDELKRFIKKCHEVYMNESNVCFNFVSGISATTLSELTNRIKSSNSLKFYKKDEPDYLKAEFDKFKDLLKISEEQVYDFIKTLNFISIDYYTLKEFNYSIIHSHFNEKPERVHDFLLNYIKENMGRKINRDQILSKIDQFKPYHINHTDLDKIKEINNDFIDKIKCKTDIIIQRDEISNVKRTIENRENIIILGDGGVGKSTFLYQIIENIHRERDYLILDLETYSSKLNNKNNIHEALDLDNLIEFTLSKRENPLVIIDQIDILPFIDSSNLTFTLNKFLRNLKSNNIPYIITYRKFNHENIFHLKKLINDRESNITEINLKPFTNKQINDFLKKMKIKIPLDSEIIKFLSIPLHLKLLSELCIDSNYPLKDINRLYYEYWQTIQKKYNNKYDNWEDLLNYIFDYMEKNETYHIPLDPPKFKDELDFLSSEKLLIKTENGYIFFHERISDYFYSLNFKMNGKNLKDYLVNSEQRLHLRRFVKILLEFEKEKNYDKYINIAQELLESEEIRVHLKILILDILNHTSEIKKEFAILKEFIINRDNALHEAVWNSIYKNSDAWFRYFNKHGLIDKYIERDLKDKITHLLIINKNSPETAKLFLDKLNKSEEWNENAMSFIQFAPMSNDNSFNLLIKLIKENIYSSKFHTLNNYFHVLTLFQLSSSQFIDVLHAFMNNIMENKKFNINDLALNHISTNDDLFDNIINDEDCSLKFIKKILPLMIKISDLNHYKYLDSELKKDNIWQNVFSSIVDYKIMKTENGIEFNEDPNGEIHHQETFAEKMRKYMILSITTIYHDNFEEFNKIKEKLIKSNIDSFLEILLEIYSIGDNDKTEICPIITNEKFFELRTYPEFIKTNISLLDNHEREELEKQILEYFKNKADKEEIEYRILKNIKNPSKMTENRIQDLTEKYDFNQNTEVLKQYTCNIPLKDAKNYTDKDWRYIFNEYNQTQSFGIDPHTFWKILSELSKEDPLRFIHIIESSDEEIHKDYCNAILDGVSKSEIDFDNSLRLCKSCHSLSNKPCGKGIIDLLSKFPEKLNNKEYLGIINYYLTEDSDPSTKTCAKYYDNIESAGLNSVRGYTADRLRYIFYHNQELVRLFEPSLKKLVKDPCISVRAMAAGTLIYIQDNNLKLELFKELININEDKILETKRVKFLLYNICDKFDESDYLIRKMINSKNPQINKNIGEIIAYYSLVNDKWNDYLDLCLNKNNDLKIGILNVISNIKTINNNIIEKLLEKFFEEDDDEEIDRLVSLCMSRIDKDSILRNEALLKKFVKSKNNYNYWDMLYNFNKIIEYDNSIIILDLLAIIIKKFQNRKFRELNQGHGIFHECLDLILNIYRMNNKKAEQKCLDLIDDILILPATDFLNNKINDILVNKN